jgi:hypothetical protein
VGSSLDGRGSARWRAANGTVRLGQPRATARARIVGLDRLDPSAFAYRRLISETACADRRSLDN